jgi:hypothetical protein
MNLKGYRPQTLSGAVVAASLTLNILLWIITLITFPKNSSNAVLHYTAGVGIDFIGEGWQIITLPSIGLILVVVNVVLARIIAGASTIAFWILWMSMPFLQLLLLVTYGILLSFNA